MSSETLFNIGFPLWIIFNFLYLSLAFKLKIQKEEKRKGNFLLSFYSVISFLISLLIVTWMRFDCGRAMGIWAFDFCFPWRIIMIAIVIIWLAGAALYGFHKFIVNGYIRRILVKVLKSKRGKSRDFWMRYFAVWFIVNFALIATWLFVAMKIR